MFIMARRNIELPSSDSTQIHRVAKGFVGDIPDWAADTAYFRALVADGKIVVPASTKDRDLAAAEEKPGPEQLKQLEDEPGSEQVKQPEDEPGPEQPPAKTSSKKGK